MEQNILKTNLITEETVLCETLEQSIDTDYSLPDYCNDISRILKCKAKPRISLKNVSGKTVTVDGTVSITVYYSDDGGKINSYNQVYPFEKIKQTDIDLQDSAVDVSAKCEYLNCRAVTGRKIDIHGAIAIKICATAKKQCEIVSDIDDETVEVLSGTAPATTPTGYAEKYLIIEEDGELSPDITAEKIFSSDAVACVKETKIISGKALVKGEMNLVVKYLSKCKIRCFNTSIPFSQILEIETAGDTCEVAAKASVSFLEITPKTDSLGNFNSFSINAKILVCAKSYCNNDLPVILDAYSKKNCAEISREKIRFKKLKKRLNETFNCKKSIMLEEGNIAGVLDNWCDIKINDSGFSGEGLFVNGTVTAQFIIEDSDGFAAFFEKPIDFTYRYPTDSENLICEPSITLSSCSYTITSTDSLEIKVELSVSGAIYENSDIDIVVGVKEGEANEIPKSDSAMIIYFASDDEKIWDISKKYHASTAEIKAINGLNDDCIKGDLTLLIPVS